LDFGLEIVLKQDTRGRGDGEGFGFWIVDFGISANKKPQILVLLSV
jgi:hypothetical protein